MMQVTIEFGLNPGVEQEFDTALTQMQERVQRYAGFLGEQACRAVDDDNHFVTIFYFRDRESIRSWRQDPDHRQIQKLGREKILSWYRIRVAEVERDYDWAGEPG